MFFFFKEAIIFISKFSFKSRLFKIQIFLNNDSYRESISKQILIVHFKIPFLVNFLESAEGTRKKNEKVKREGRKR